MKKSILLIAVAALYSSMAMANGYTEPDYFKIDNRTNDTLSVIKATNNYPDKARMTLLKSIIKPYQHVDILKLERKDGKDNMGLYGVTIRDNTTGIECHYGIAQEANTGYREAPKKIWITQSPYCSWGRISRDGNDYTLRGYFGAEESAKL